MDGTKCVVAAVGQTVHEQSGTVSEFVLSWKTNDANAWVLPNWDQYDGNHDNTKANPLEWAKAHLPFKYEIVNTRWAALFHCGKRLVADPRLETIRCFRCGDDTIAMAPIMDDIDLQRWSRYLYWSESDELCYREGSLYMGKWIHNPQRSHTPPRVQEGTAAIMQWFNSYPMMGVYIALNDELQSLNAGYGCDIQEVMPPDPDPADPTGAYWYINDRNAPVRYDKQITNSDQAWPHNCVAPSPKGNIPITFSALSLEDLPAAPSVSCQNEEKQGVEGTNRGLVVIGGNNVLRIIDSEFGVYDYDCTTFRALVREKSR